MLRLPVPSAKATFEECSTASRGGVSSGVQGWDDNAEPAPETAKRSPQDHIVPLSEKAESCEKKSLHERRRSDPIKGSPAVTFASCCRTHTHTHARDTHAKTRQASRKRRRTSPQQAREQNEEERNGTEREKEPEK